MQSTKIDKFKVHSCVFPTFLGPHILRRFGGDKFPPIILFKIFISGRTTGVKYLSGKKMIQPASNVK